MLEPCQSALRINVVAPTVDILIPRINQHHEKEH